MKNLIREIHRRSLWQVMGIYVGTSWVVLQVVEQLAETLSLPVWVRPLALILLLIGLPIILATAFMQAGPPAGGRAEPGGEGGTVPTSSMAGPGEPGGRPRPHGPPGARAPVGILAGLRLLTWRNAILGGVLAFSLLFGFAGLYVLLSSRDGRIGPREAVAVEAAPGVAVLPFAVSGPEVEFWREGVVSALATSLDGLLGLRSIDSRTVLAQWDREAGEGRAELASALEIARRVGAAWAVTGDLVATPTRMQIAATVYDVKAGAAIGQPVRVTGSADGDSTFVLLDRLAIEVLRQIPRPEGVDLPDADLARATTGSVEALRAYLEGEAHFRRSDFDAAVGAYNRAIELDSTFAMAHYRLSLAYGWMGEGGQTGGHVFKAAALADRLPERDRLLARGNRAFLVGAAYEAVAILEDAVARYPDDVEAWTILGDAWFHLGEQIGPDYLAEAERAFARAVELDPGASVAYIHRVDAAFQRGDSAATAERMARYRELAAGSDYDASYDLAWDLAFGPDSARQAALAELAEAAARGDARISGGTIFWALNHPRFWKTRVEAMERLMGGPAVSTPAARALALARLDRGQVRAMRDVLAEPGLDPTLRLVLPFAAHELGYPIPEADLPASGTDDAMPLAAAFVAAALAAERGAWSEFEERTASLSSLDVAWWDDPYVRAAAEEQRDALVKALRAYATWQRGAGAAAAAPLVEAQRASTGWGPIAALNAVQRWWVAELLRELGRHAEAVPYYRSLWPVPMATLRLAEIHDAAGDLERAAVEYAQFLDMWRDADPELQPGVQAARERLQAIVAARG